MNKLPKALLVALMIVLVFPFILYTIVGLVFTIRAGLDPNQARFRAGKFPDPLPNGLMNGNAAGQGSWIGKEFNAAAQSGINNFREGETINKSFPFKTYKGVGLRDAQEVLKLDYNLPENPLLTRLILDELVEIAPGKYLGKLHLRLIPFIPFTVTYFELSK